MADDNYDHFFDNILLMFCGTIFATWLFERWTEYKKVERDHQKEENDKLVKLIRDHLKAKGVSQSDPPLT